MCDFEFDENINEVEFTKNADVRKVDFEEAAPRVKFEDDVLSSPSSSSSSCSGVELDDDLLDRYYKNYDSDDSFKVRAVRKSSCPPALN